MSIWPVYLLIAVIQLFRKRVQSSKALAVGVFIGISQAIFFELMGNPDPVLFYSSMWLLSFGWFCILDYLNLNKSAIAILFLVLFQLIMMFSAFDGAVMDTVLYAMYPYVIIVANVIMIVMAIGEKDEMATITVSDHRNSKGDHKSKGAA